MNVNNIDVTLQTIHNCWMRQDFYPGLVSVIIPTYNRKALIGQTLGSVFAQTYRPIEIIIIDDGSTDNTEDFVKNWQLDKHSSECFEIKYFKQENQGGSVARNRGLIESRGEYIQYLDSDDILCVNKIAKQVNLLKKSPELNCVFGDWRFFIQNEFKYILSPSQVVFDADNALQEWLSTNNFVPSHSILWKRKTVLEVGPWNESLQADQDGDIMFRFLLLGGKLNYCSGSWVYYRNYMDNSSVRKHFSEQSANSRLIVTKEVIDCLEKNNLLNEYINAISQRYAFFAIRWTPFSRKYSSIALKLCKKYSENKKLPDKFNHPLLTSMIGPYYKHKIANFFRNKKKVNQITFKKEAILNNIESLYEFDSP